MIIYLIVERYFFIINQHNNQYRNKMIFKNMGGQRDEGALKRIRYNLHFKVFFKAFKSSKLSNKKGVHQNI
ncbi:hypothetical protein AA81_10835 [Petrotoga halophila DSM 16923]|uniref:Uncharacterized protein n=1 Tax=Petrotoga halophila DSM 16923 TaxID=1122953 RepID=A0A2S5EDE4_9BACT|nr:hypothetical protein AA81_10835 [Petrotoga halophila DSM 16923]